MSACKPSSWASALLLAFAAIIAVVGISSLTGVERGAEQMYTQSTQPLAELGIARATANENRPLLNNHLLNSHIEGADAAEQRSFERKIVANHRTIDGELGKVERSLQRRTARWRSRGSRARSPTTASRGTRSWTSRAG